MATKVGAMAIGKVIKINRYWKAAKVSVQTLKLDENTNVYINWESKCWASDKDYKGNLGDMVMVKELEKLERPYVTHQVHKVIFPLGNITEPTTGKRCKGDKYIDTDNRNLT